MIWCGSFSVWLQISRSHVRIFLQLIISHLIFKVTSWCEWQVCFMHFAFVRSKVRKKHNSISIVTNFNVSWLFDTSYTSDISYVKITMYVSTLLNFLAESIKFYREKLILTFRYTLFKHRRLEIHQFHWFNLYLDHYCTRAKKCQRLQKGVSFSCTSTGITCTIKYHL